MKTIQQLETELAEVEASLADSTTKLESARQEHRRVRTAEAWKKVEAAMIAQRRFSNERDGVKEDLEGARKLHAAAEHAKSIAACDKRARASELGQFLTEAAPKIERVSELEKELQSVRAELTNVASKFSRERDEVVALSRALGVADVAPIPYQKVIEASLAMSTGADPKEILLRLFNVTLPRELDAARALDAASRGIDLPHVLRLIQRLKDSVSAVEFQAKKFCKDPSEARGLPGSWKAIPELRAALDDLGFGDVAAAIRVDSFAARLAGANLEQIAGLVFGILETDAKRIQEVRNGHTDGAIAHSQRVADMRAKLTELGLPEVADLALAPYDNGLGSPRHRDVSAIQASVH